MEETVKHCETWACFLSLAQSKLRLCSANHRPGPVFCLLLWVSSDYAQPITGQVTEVTCPVIGRAQHELTPSKGQKTGPGYWSNLPCDWPSTAWAYSEQETENGPWTKCCVPSHQPSQHSPAFPSFSMTTSCYSLTTSGRFYWHGLT